MTKPPSLHLERPTRLCRTCDERARVNADSQRRRQTIRALDLTSSLLHLRRRTRTHIPPNHASCHACRARLPGSRDVNDVKSERRLIFCGSGLCLEKVLVCFVHASCLPTHLIPAVRARIPSYKLRCMRAFQITAHTHAYIGPASGLP